MLINPCLPVIVQLPGSMEIRANMVREWLGCGYGVVVVGLGHGKEYGQGMVRAWLGHGYKDIVSMGLIRNMIINNGLEHG